MGCGDVSDNKTMSKTDQYFRVPMCMLSYGNSPEEALNAMLDVATVNAGLAEVKKMSSDEVDAAYYEEQKKQGLKESARCREETAAVIGAGVVGMTWGCWRNVKSAGESYREIERADGYESFFTISATSLWTALDTAREERSGTGSPERRMSYREFRILAAICSAQTNRYGFVFLGWRGIQHRACGVARRKDFDDCEDFPEHCLPLSRDQIDRTLKRLESLRFFLRVRHSSGKRGGFTAYSFRHADRESLVRDVVLWQDFNQGRIVEQNREEDARLTLKIKGTRN